MIYIVKSFSVANEAEIDVFLEFFFFFYHPKDFGNLISGSSAFFKSSSYNLEVIGSDTAEAWRILSSSLLACEMNGIVW